MLYLNASRFVKTAKNGHRFFYDERPCALMCVCSAIDTDPYIGDNLSVRLNVDCLALRSIHIKRFGTHVYRPLTKLREGNVFTGVILSVILSTGIGYTWTQVPSAGVGMPGTSSLMGVCAGGWICIWIRRMKQCTIPKVINRIPFRLRSESVYMSHTFRHIRESKVYL